MDSTTPLAPRILDAAEAIVIGDGLDALGYGTLSERLGVARESIRATYPVFEQLLGSVLARMTASLAHVVVDNVERDPRGGLPSRIYGYALSAIYETPLARALYFTDPQALARTMRTLDGVGAVPDLSISPALLPDLQTAGMARADIDASSVSAVLQAIGAGVSMTSSEQRLSDISAGLRTLLERAVDADPEDTAPGKEIAYRYAARVIRAGSLS
ncbi:hypothetical protein [Salinibacterium sp. ZJ77]|uniref:hypothetical protein n=1 Tax=Salinibacterium sp. ZJ77 TaxID=2708337 RepID=UPI001423A81B|nr:hypothetical protein [Salinibacterium sp. ZJ77]